MAVTDHVAKLPYVDDSRIVAAGGSYGGYMIDWILGHTNRFKALISHAAFMISAARRRRQRSCGFRCGSSRDAVG